MSHAAPIAPGELAERLTGRDYLSWSSLSTFQACPLKWYFHYVLGLREERVGSSLVFGGAIHRALEFHFRELLAGSSPPEVDCLLGEYQAAWLERDSGAIRFGKNESPGSLLSLAERMLTTFCQSPLSRPAGQILGVEEELRGEVAAGCPDLLARIDLVVDEGETLVITDFKTARSRWTQQRADQSGEQLLLYGELARRLVPGKPVRLEFLIVTKTKSPAIEPFSIAADPVAVARTEQMISQIWRAIQYGAVYPAPSAIDCGYCPFRKPCQRWSG